MTKEVMELNYTGDLTEHPCFRLIICSQDI